MIVNINQHDYEIKNGLTFGQIKKINKSYNPESINNEVLDLTNKTPEEMVNLIPKLENQQKMNDEQLELMGDIVKTSLDISDDDLGKIPFDDIKELYQSILETSQPKKKQSQQYA